MQIRFSTQQPEIEFSGNRKDYLILAAMLRQPDGHLHFPAETNNPDPYDAFALGVLVQSTALSKVVINLDFIKGEVRFSGDPKWLNVLADNLEGLACEAENDYHIHVEYFEGHFYLSPQSTPTIFRLTK